MTEEIKELNLVKTKKKEYLLIKFLKIFKNLFIKMGIDFDQMIVLLSLKLTMDSRRINTNFKVNQAIKPQTGTYIAYLFLGVFGCAILFIGSDLYIKVSLFLSYVSVMMTMVMITDFSNVMLDIKERTILNTKPISSKVISVTKTIHILNYMIIYTALLSLPSIIFLCIQSGILILPFLLLSLILIDILIVFVTSILYIVVLSSFDGEKLKDIITFFQIMMSIITMVGFQVFNNTFQLINLKMVLIPRLYHLLMPPMWFASWFIKENTFILWSLRIFAILIPISLFIVYIKYLSKKFERHLVKLEENGEKINRNNINRKRKIRKKLGTLFTKTKTEKTGFLFALVMITKDRKLKAMILPSIAMGVCIPLLFVIRSKYSDFSMKNPHMWVYLTIFSCSVFSRILLKSEYFKGAWVYNVFPIDNYFEFVKGVQKAFLLKYVSAALTIVFSILTFMQGIECFLDLLCVLPLLLILVRIDSYVCADKMTFSEDPANIHTEKGEMIGQSIAFMSGLGVLVLIHLVAKKIPFGVTILTVIYILIAYILWNFNINKKKYKIQNTL